MSMNVDKGVIKSFILLLAVVSILGAFFLTMYIWGIVGGAIFNVVLNGTLPVTTGTEAFLNATETAFFTNMQTVRNSALTAAGLIAVAVILIIFSQFIKTGKTVYQDMKGGRRGGSKDMGY